MSQVSGATLVQVFSAAEAGIPLGRPANDLVMVPLDRIVPCRWQPRQRFEAGALLELALDIEQHGVLTPPLVWLNEDMEYELIAGERRIRACYALCLDAAGKINPLEKAVAHVAVHGFGGLARELRENIAASTLPAVMAVATVQCREVWGTGAQLHELALVDNLQRQDLAPLEEARALHDLIQEYGYTQRDLAGRLGKSQTWVSQRLNLLGLTPEVAEKVTSGEVDPATAREIARLEKEVQPAMVAHLQAHGMKSKAAANLVGKVLEMSEPEYFAGPSPVAARKLAHVALAKLPHAGARQAAVLRVAGVDGKGQLGVPTESHQYKDFIAATGIVGEGATRYNVDISTLWGEQAAATGYVCGNCRINGQRDLVAAVNETVKSHRETHEFNAEGWPACAAGKTTCKAFTGPDEPLNLPLPYMSRDFPYTDEEKVHLGEYAYGRHPVRDVAAWVSIVLRYYQLQDQQAAQRQDAQENGIQRALTAYVEAQVSENFDAGHFWSQTCERCVFHKVEATDPAEFCQFQANPPAWSGYGSKEVARLWQSGNAPLVGRCRLFRLKQPEVHLPDLPGAGLDVFAPGLLYVLLQLAGKDPYRGTIYAARWLDVKRTNAEEAPTWRDAEPMLVRTIAGLRSGQKLALLLLWADPFGWFGWSSGSFGKALEASVYVPALGRAVTYTLVRQFNG